MSDKPAVGQRSHDPSGSVHLLEPLRGILLTSATREQLGEDSWGEV